MALATVCPHCDTTFRVASDQLKLRGGIVRCGACNQVFDGNAALIDLNAPASASIPVPVPVPIPVLVPISVPETVESALSSAPSASDAFDAEVAAIEAHLTERNDAPVFSLDFDTTYDPLGIAPQPEPDSEAAEPEREIDEASVAFFLPDDEPDEPDDDVQPGRRDAAPAPSSLPLPGAPGAQHAALPMRASAVTAFVPVPAPALPSALARTARRNAAKRQKAAAAAAELAARADEPEFVTRSRQQEQTGPTRRLAMGAASALLLLVLVVQCLATFRNGMAARFPQWKPVLEAGCAVFGCRIELPAQIDALSVETGELQALGGNTFSYSTELGNPGSLAQAWPHLELTLSDDNDKPLVRRVFAAVDYLPPSVPVAKGFAARSEQPVKLFFTLNQLKASGYHIAIFYP